MSSCVFAFTKVCRYTCVCMDAYFITITVAIALLRKHYNKLLTSMPDDHVTTIGLLSESIPLHEVFFDEIISLTDHRVANEKILNALILHLDHDNQMKGFCTVVKLIVKRECQFSNDMLMFEMGMFYLCIPQAVNTRHACTDTHIHACTHAHIHMYIHNHTDIHTRTYITIPYIYTHTTHTVLKIMFCNQQISG